MPPVRRDLAPGAGAPAFAAPASRGDRHLVNSQSVILSHAVSPSCLASAAAARFLFASAKSRAQATSDATGRHFPGGGGPRRRHLGSPAPWLRAVRTPHPAPHSGYSTL